MPKDKFTATWVSHSSISDYQNCPRAYFLNHVYKDLHTGHKITLMSAHLALGQIVHQVLESISLLPAEKRFAESLIAKYEQAWSKITGRKGGFENDQIETKFKNRGAKMLRRVMENPGPLMNKAVKIKMDLPYFWLSEPDNIILCGKIDWLEYLPEIDSVHIIDFKTGSRDEIEDSLQLSIYLLLVTKVQSRPVAKASYWYLDRDDQPTEVKLPDIVKAQEKIMKIAKKIKVARQLGHFKCPLGDNGCRVCRPLEKVVRGEAEFVGVDDYNQDVYILKTDVSGKNEERSVIL